MDKQKQKDIERMLKKRRIVSNTNCWEWTGLINKNGSGAMHLTIDKKKYKTVEVYRYAYQLLTGTILKKENILHHICNNRLCFNPDHLKVTSQRKNILHKNKDWGLFCSEHKELIERYDNLKKEIETKYINWSINLVNNT